ncbi:hypothetical protein QZH41_009663 [Actinostola sp. cb2023]|nr:hypothetical protein QZH41_009663 [Actinostola sp. cb2023]
MSLVLLLFVFFCFPLGNNCEGEATPATQVIISTRYGKLKGLTRQFDKSIGLGNVSTVNKFLGIPFAAPPIGDLRFRPPQKPKPWKGIYDATDFKHVCYQDSSYNRRLWPKRKWPHSDDCLYLNVYAPNTTVRKIRYPVMVYIHGGGYEAGSPVVSPGDVLPLWDVVLVTIQYRLGPFGFVSTGDSEAPGNYGMLDQIEALKWIQENIGVFKGDPSRVMIFGESAGGSSVGLLLLSPLSKGLFHSAIALSGIDFSPFAINAQEEALHLTHQTANKLSCPTRTSDEIIKCMRRVDASRIFNVTESDVNRWRPVVDGVFLPDTPLNLRKAMKFHPYPLLVGLTSEEGSYFISKNYLSISPAPFINTTTKFYELFFQFGRSKAEFNPPPSLKEAIAFQYTPWPDNYNEVKRRKRIDLISDYSFTAPAHAVLELHTKVAPGYLFVFSHRSKFNPPSWKGAAHKDDTPYEFGFPLMRLNVLQEYDEHDRNVSEIIITLFTNFARTKNPTPQPLRDCTLTEFNLTNHAYLNITARPRVEHNFHGNNVAFWNKYYPKLLKYPHCKSDQKPQASTSGSMGTITYSPGLVALLVLNMLSCYCK